MQHTGALRCLPVVELAGAQERTEITRWRQLRVKEIAADQLRMALLEGDGEFVGIASDAPAPKVRALEGLKVDDYRAGGHLGGASLSAGTRHRELRAYLLVLCEAAGACSSGNLPQKERSWRAR